MTQSAVLTPPLGPQGGLEAGGPFTERKSQFLVSLRCFCFHFLQLCGEMTLLDVSLLLKLTPRPCFTFKSLRTRGRKAKFALETFQKPYFWTYCSFVQTQR